MKANTRIIILTMAFSLVIWVVCVTLASIISSNFSSTPDSRQLSDILIYSSLAVTLVASLIVGVIMSRMSAQRQKTLKSLGESEEKFRALSEASFEGTFIHDGNIFLEANETGARMLGCEPGYLRGKTAINYMVPESIELVLNNIRQGYNDPYEIVARRQDGTTFPAELRGRDILYKGQKVRVATMRDLTQRNEAQMSLKVRAELLDACTDSISVRDFNGNFLYVNEKACKSHGYTRDELMRINIRSLEVPESARLIKDRENELQKADSVIFECMHYRKDKSILPLEVHARIFRWKEKECILSVARDISERKQAEDLLKNISINSPVSTYILQDGKFQYVNKRMIAKSGYTEAELLEMDPQKLALPEERENLRQNSIGMLKGERLTPFEHRNICKDGSIIWTLETITHVQYRGKRAILGTLIDITEQKAAEEALKKSEQNLKEAQNLGKMGNWEFDVATQKIDWSDETFRLYERDSSLGPPTPEEEAHYYSTEDGRKIRELTRTAIENGKNFTYDLNVKLPGGKNAFFNATMHPVMDKNGRVVKLFGTVQDITERKQTEELLKNISLNSPVGTYIVQEGRFKFVNPKFMTDTGYAEAELLTMDSLNIVHPEDREMVREKAIRLLKGQGSASYEFRAMAKDGSIHWAIESVTPSQYQGKRATIGTFIDITERKMAEEALKESEEKFRRLAENAPDIIYRYRLSPKRTFEYVSPAAFAITGYTPEEHYADPELVFKLVHPEDRYVLQSWFTPVAGSANKSALARLIRKDGSIIWVNHRKIVVGDESGEVVAVEGIVSDITEDMRMEEALRTSERNFRNSMEESPLGIRIVTDEGETIFVNKALLDMYGYENLKEFRDKSLKERYTSESYQQYQERSEQRKRGEFVGKYEIDIVRKDGTVRNLEVFRKEVLWGGELQFQTIYHDITKRKTAEAEIEKLARFPSENPHPVLRVQKDGVILYANVPSMPLLEMWGCEAEAKLPQPWQKIVADAVVSGEHYETEVSYLDHIYMLSVVPIKNSDYVNIYGRDITKRKQAEQALRVSEQNFRNSIDNSPMGILITSYLIEPTELIYANRALLDIYGYKNIEEMRSIPAKDRFTPKSYAEYLVRKERRLRSEALPPVFELEVTRKDGTIHYLQAFTKEIIWDGEQRLQVLYHNITEQKRAEQALQESERNFRELVETAQEGIWVIDDKTNITFANQRMAEILGYTVVDLTGRSLLEFTSKEGIEVAMRHLERRRLGIRDEFDIEYIHKNGKTVYARVGGAPVYDSERKYLGAMSVVTDITELKQAQERILHLNSVLNALRGINQLITFQKDKKQLIQKSCDILVNARGYETAWIMLIEKSGDLASGANSGLSQNVYNSLVDMFKMSQHPACINTLLKQDNLTLRCDEAEKQEHACPIAECGQNLGALAGKLFYGGRLYGFLGVQLCSSLANDSEEQSLFHEITQDIAFALDTIEREAQLKESEAQALEAEKLREIDRLRAELLANVSHELRTPLAAIKGYTTTLLRRDVRWSVKDKQDFLLTIDRETDRLTRLISDILDMSRIDAGALKLKMGEYDIRGIINSVRGRLEVMTVRHQLKIQVPDELPAIFVDEMRIGQVISNLVENAVKFSSADSLITIEAQRDKENVIISVADQGGGMTREVMDKLFNRFYQAEDVVRGRRSGTGLGLAICRGIIENHGGKIWVESEVKKGSKFSFSLPVRDPSTELPSVLRSG